MKRKISILLAVIMVFSVFMTASADPSGRYDVTVWVSENAIDLTKQQIADFNASNQDGITIDATVQGVSEADAATMMITDVEAGGDLYCFAQDQLARLVQAGALKKVVNGAAENVKSANNAGTVAAATSGDDLYAYPMTSDNGYFMYYDKSVIPDADVDSMEKLLADCENSGKYFGLDTSAWYLASFFFATGCNSEWTTDSTGSFVGVKDDFNSDKGLIAAKGLKKLVESPSHVSAGSADQFEQDAAVVISGTWDYEQAKQILGDNLGVADLPSFEVDGKEYHLGSYSGCKLMGVKPQVDAEKEAALSKLAQYLTGEKAQMERFEALSWGPSNLADQASEAVQANPGLVALYEQEAYSVPQGQIHGAWWDIARGIGQDVKDASDEAGLKTALENYSDKIAALAPVSDEQKEAWTVIGTIGDTDWDTDVPMILGDDGVWTTGDMQLFAGDEFKVRQGMSWLVSFPLEKNFIVEADGVYRIIFNETSKAVGLVACDDEKKDENKKDEEPVDPTTKVADFVKRCYSLILGRDADEGGLNNWVTQLTAGVANASQIISGFMNSAEYLNRNSANDATVEILYNTMLGRPSDPAGKQGWVDQLNAGGDSNTVINGFCGSQEFLAICADYGIAAGSVDASGGQAGQPEQETGIDGFVARCYSEALGRTGDEGGLAYWKNILTSKEQTPQQVAAGFVYSQEMDAGNKLVNNPDALLDSLYKLYLGRTADEAGKDYWRQRIAEGLSLDELNAGFANSAEFTGIVAGYGLE